MSFKNRGPRRDCAALDALILENIRFARKLWGLSGGQRATLKALTRKFHMSVTLGDLRLLDASWYVTHSGLTRLARRSHCAGINVQSMREYCDPASSRWVFKATVYKSAGSRGFVGHGDADPSNTSTLVRGAEMRVAETRAVNRALRKAYGIGICSVEERGYLSWPTEFCGTDALREASRDLVEAFISTLADEAAKDRAALICKLNSYNQLAEV